MPPESIRGTKQLSQYWYRQKQGKNFKKVWLWLKRPKSTKLHQFLGLIRLINIENSHLKKSLSIPKPTARAFSVNKGNTQYIVIVDGRWNWVRLGSFWVRFWWHRSQYFVHSSLYNNNLCSFGRFGNWVRFAFFVHFDWNFPLRRQRADTRRQTQDTRPQTQDNRPQTQDNRRRTKNAQNKI